MRRIFTIVSLGAVQLLLIACSSESKSEPTAEVSDSGADVPDSSRSDAAVTEEECKGAPAATIPCESKGSCKTKGLYCPKGTVSCGSSLIKVGATCNGTSFQMVCWDCVFDAGAGDSSPFKDSNDDVADSPNSADN